MMNTKRIAHGLLILGLLTACGRGTPTLNTAAYPTQPAVTLSQMNHLSLNATDAQQIKAKTKTTTKTSKVTLSTSSSKTIKAKTSTIKAEAKETPQKIALAPVSQKIIEVQAKLRKAGQKTANNEPSGLSKAEVSAIRGWITTMEKLFLKEDNDNAASPSKDSGFSIKSADQGKDISIEMFLYHPKYNKNAKFWGIDTANDFLKAGRSPLRRWLLKKKLEGFFAPRGFSQQILFWVEQADMLRISGVSKDDAFLLVAHGITSVPDLARRNLIELTAIRVSMALMAFQYGFDAPSQSEVKAWHDEAQTLESYIY